MRAAMETQRRRDIQYNSLKLVVIKHQLSFNGRVIQTCLGCAVPNAVRYSYPTPCTTWSYDLDMAFAYWFIGVVLLTW